MLLTNLSNSNLFSISIILNFILDFIMDDPIKDLLLSCKPPFLILTELLESGGPSRSEPSRIVIPSKRPYSAIDGNPNAINIGPPPPRMPHINQHHQMFGPPGGLPLPQQQLPPGQQQQLPMGTAPPQIQPGPMRKGFDYNRLGGNVLVLCFILDLRRFPIKSGVE